MSCTVSVREVNDIAILELAGRFTITDASGVIRGAISDLLAAGRTKILMELANVVYLDSAAGIGELVSSYTTALRQGAQLKLLHAGKNVDRVLRIVGLHNIFDIFDDEETAIRSFALARQKAAAAAPQELPTSH